MRSCRRVRSLPSLLLLLPLAQAAPPAPPTPPTPPTPSRAADPGLLARRIDDALAQTWSTRKLEPAAPVDDFTWLRRLSLDLCGTIPSRGEVGAFVADRKTDKRERKIDEHLNDRAFAENQADLWCGLLLSASVRSEERLRLRPWLEEVFARNLPFTEVTRRLLASAGRNDENAATCFLLAYEGDVETLAAVTARTFLGVQLQCAQCHDHPYDQWKQTDFNGFAGFFLSARTERVGGSGNETIFQLTDATPRDVAGDDAVMMKLQPELREKFAKLRDREDRFHEARYLGGEPWVETKFVSRRQALAAWVIDPANPWFARAVVNRMWGHLFGKGLIEPVDDLSGSHDVVAPELLATIARAFQESGGDLRFLVGALVRTRAYSEGNSQAQAPEARGEAERLFAAHPLRPFNAEQVLHALLRATATDEQEVARAHGESFEVARSKLLDRFRYVFSDDEGGAGDSFTSSIPEALFLMNGQLTNDAGRLKRSPMLEGILDQSHGDRERLREVFFATLGRPPTKRETERLTWLARTAGGGYARGVEDLYWSLLNCTEFLTNH